MVSREKISKTPDQIELERIADTIRGLVKNAVADAIEIGGHLVAAKAMMEHGKWLLWLKFEFRWSRQTADNFIALHKASKLPKFGNLKKLPIDLSAAYVLCRKSTPEGIVDAVFAQAASGRVTHDNVVQMVRQAKQDSPEPLRKIRVKVEDHILKRPIYIQAKDESGDVPIMPDKPRPETKASPAAIAAAKARVPGKPRNAEDVMKSGGLPPSVFDTHHGSELAANTAAQFELDKFLERYRDSLGDDVADLLDTALKLLTNHVKDLRRAQNIETTLQ